MVEIVKMNAIRLITTEGCEGCAIAERLIKKAISVAKVKIYLEVIDCLDPYYYDFIKQNNITDYPTTLYIVNGKVIDKTIGTMTLERFEQKINKIFN